METFTYYPGCTLRTKAKDLDAYARASAEALGIKLVEPADWQCCGGAYTTAKDEIATKLSAVRALNSAKEAGQPLITVPRATTSSSRPSSIFPATRKWRLRSTTTSG